MKTSERRIEFKPDVDPENPFLVQRRPAGSEGEFVFEKAFPKMWEAERYAHNAAVAEIAVSDRGVA